jgi:hypothetical protein
MNAVLLTALLLSFSALAGERRVALLVGSNQAEGRPTLRWAHDDAAALSRVLTELGHFDPSDVETIFEATPEAVIAALQKKLAMIDGTGLVVFYYSGHADADGLATGGGHLSYEAIKAALDAPSGAVRVGIIDACQGGGWTRTKGFKEVRPFEIGLPAMLASEGTVLLASSSGHERAHEIDQLRGSVFTHHLVAGLRGAASIQGDISLQAAFAYAQALTVRDTARVSEEPQQPSFSINLRGKRDVALTRIDPGAGKLELQQNDGPMQVVDLGSGVTVLELPRGKQLANVVIAPGEYLVRVVSGDEVRSHSVTVSATGGARVAETQLERSDPTLTKDAEVDPARYRLFAGVGSSLASLSAMDWTFPLEIGAAWRFWSIFSLTVNGAWMTNRSPIKQQLERDFGVLPSAFVSLAGRFAGEVMATFTRFSRHPQIWFLEPEAGIVTTLNFFQSGSVIFPRPQLGARAALRLGIIERFSLEMGWLFGVEIPSASVRFESDLRFGVMF